MLRRPIVAAAIAAILLAVEVPAQPVAAMMATTPSQLRGATTADNLELAAWHHHHYWHRHYWLGACGLGCDGAAESGSAGLLGAFSVAGGAWWWWYGYGGGGTGDGAKASPMMVAAKTGGNTSASNAGANDDGDAMRPVRDCPQ